MNKTFNKNYRCYSIFLILLGTSSLAFGASTQINTYQQLRNALENGEVPIIASVDFQKCQPDETTKPIFYGKDINTFYRNTVNQDGSILMVTSYKLNPQVVEEKQGQAGKDIAPWIEWQSAYTINKNATQFKVRYISTDQNNKVIQKGNYLCPLNNAVLLWRTSHN